MQLGKGELRASTAAVIVAAAAIAVVAGAEKMKTFGPAVRWKKRTAAAARLEVVQKKTFLNKRARPTPVLCHYTDYRSMLYFTLGPFYPSIGVLAQAASDARVSA